LRKASSIYIFAIALMVLSTTVACATGAEQDSADRDASMNRTMPVAGAGPGEVATAAGAAAAEGGPPMPPPITLKPVREGSAPPNPYSEEQIERGRFLVSFGSCNDCHTPWTFDPSLGLPVPDMTRMLSGHPEGVPDSAGALGAGDAMLVGPTFTSFTLPFGTVYAMNLTPDLETGTGTWTEEMFVDIFRKGKHLGGNGRGVLPPMPWNWVRMASDEDLVAIFAYLRSVPPLVNNVPSANVPEPAIDQLTQIAAMMANASREQ
jgi:hypothetical protein